MTIRDLKIKSIQYRKQILQYIKQANAGHTGGSLSCIDILNVLYNQVLRVSPETFQFTFPRPVHTEQRPFGGGFISLFWPTRVFSPNRNCKPWAATNPILWVIPPAKYQE